MSTEDQWAQEPESPQEPKPDESAQTPDEPGRAPEDASEPRPQPIATAARRNWQPLARG